MDSLLWPQGSKEVSVAASKVFDHNRALKDQNFNAIDRLLREKNGNGCTSAYVAGNGVKNGECISMNHTMTQLELPARMRIFEDVMIGRIQLLQNAMKKER